MGLFRLKMKKKLPRPQNSAKTKNSWHANRGPHLTGGWDSYEPWRLDKLRSLKAKYDPQNRFRYFEPIVSGST
jgi:hypothetical protein